MIRPYMNVTDRDFLRAVTQGCVYQSLGGHVMQRGGLHGGQNKRAAAPWRKAVAAGWVHEKPDPETRLYRLTGSGAADLAARELGGVR